MFGMMGAGKSTFANTLLGWYQFKEGDGASSVTETIEKSGVKKPNGAWLNVLDVPGLGDPDVTKVKYCEKFMSALKDKINSTTLNTVIIVKKATDFRVTTEFAWYQIVLKTIL